MPWTFLRHPAFYALGLILAVEAAVYLNSRQIVTPERYARNPWFRRAWPEYMAATSQPVSNELRILIISNSQGYGREVPESEIYSEILAHELQKQFPSNTVSVINWSVPPCRGPEPIILLAQAQLLEPDLTLCLLSPGSFAERYYHLQPGHRQLRRWFARTELGRALRRRPFWKRLIQGQPRPTPFSMFLSDVSDSAWWARQRLPSSFSHYFSPAVACRAWLARLWPSFRVRERPLAYLARETFFLRPFLHQREFQTWFAPSYKASDFIDRGEDAEWLQRKAYLPLVELMVETARPLPGEKVFVNQPLRAAESGDDDTTAFVQSLVKGGWEYRDMRNALPAEAFFPRGTHFTREGHHQFALHLTRMAAPLLLEGVQKP